MNAKTLLFALLAGVLALSGAAYAIADFDTDGECAARLAGERCASRWPPCLVAGVVNAALPPAFDHGPSGPTGALGGPIAAPARRFDRIEPRWCGLAGGSGPARQIPGLAGRHM